MISKFVIVGGLGFVLQLLTLWALTSLAGVAVAARDRSGGGGGGAAQLRVARTVDVGR